MSLTQLLTILRSRWLTGAVVFVLTVSIVVGVSLLLPKAYTATAAVVVDVRTPDPIAGMATAAVAPGANMVTQVDIIKSDRVALRVVDRLRLTADQDLRQRWQEEVQSRGDFASWIAEILQRQLDVKPSRESNVITVSYASGDPKFSATVANAFVQAYLDTNLELRTEPARQYSSFFDERGQQVREQLEKAQAKLSAYQREKGIIATDERVDIETARLNELSSQLVAVQALSVETSSRQSHAGEQLSEVLNNPLIASLKGDIARQEAKLQELNSRLGENNPQVIEAKASLSELRGRVAAETRRVTSSVTTNANINRAREAEIRAALEAQRARVLKMKELRDEAAVLVRDVENAQKTYDSVAARQAQTSIESQTQLTNVSMLNPAVEPSRHSSPRIRLNAILAMFAGGVLAIGAALLRELLDRRVRSIEDVLQLIDLPVIGVMSRPARSLIHRPTALQRRLLTPLPRPGK
jgi:chain length determinant protein EpsF